MAAGPCIARTAMREPCAALLRPCAAQGEAVFPNVQQTLAAHAAELRGKRAAVHAEVIGELLAVERDRKAVAARADRLHREVGEQAAADRFRRGVEDAPGKREILLRADEQKVADELRVAGAGLRAGRKQVRRVQEKRRRILCRDDVHHQRLIRHAGVRLRENLPRPHAVQNALAAPCVVALDVHAAREDEPDRLGAVAGAAEHRALFVLPPHGSEAAEQPAELTGRDVPEKLRLC